MRDVARQCGKEVELAVRGGHTDLDKSILDAIAEPLTHLVRNAIGHGIETAEERVRAGKRREGNFATWARITRETRWSLRSPTTGRHRRR